MLTLSWPCGFSESKSWIIFRMPLVEKVILDKNLSVLSKSSDGRLLPSLITLYCLAKNELNNSAFFVKSVIKPLSQNKGGKIGAFCYSKTFIKSTHILCGIR